MARVPYVDPSQSPGEPGLAGLYSDIAQLRGSVRNLQRAIANQPAALKAFMGMSRYVRNEASLDPKLRELAVLATAHAHNVAYEIHYHVIAARRVGVSEEQLAAFPRWEVATCFSEVERAVISYADEVTRRLEVDDTTFEQLRAHLSTPEIVDLALTVGWYHLCTALIVPLQIEIGTQPV